ncbi:SMP-30/gluconolactonase/LRE family protein [Nocardia sp. NPDC051463]|uniref:SMP-30/gluconolactonase/LRE family protein n=1 Tax=Nocardia sp. NPDC051463 TaxID=3154845 RepID=UPI00344CAC95
MDIAVQAAAALGEGPAWDAGTDTLLWVDIVSSQVHRSRLDGRTDTIECSQPVTAVIPDDGPLPVSARDGFGYLHDDGHVQLLARTVESDCLTRMNDGKCDPDGVFWAGSMACDEQSPIGNLYQWGGGNHTATLRSGTVISNGLDWSPCGDTAYYIDSFHRRIDRFERADTGVGWRTASPLAVVDPRMGTPDGLTVDHDGGIWVALNFGGQVARYTPGGVLDTIVHLPTRCPTSLTFGGPKGEVLLITTARVFLSPAQLSENPQAGCVLALDVGTTGPPARSMRR